MGSARLRVTAAGALLLPLVLAGCSHHPRFVEPSEPPPPSEPPTTASGLHDGYSSFPQRSTRAAHAPSLRWSRIAVIDGGRRVVISASKTDCTDPSYAVLVETARTVRIAVMGYTVPEPCAAEDLTLVGFVTLAEPLGGRPLIHARVTER